MYIICRSGNQLKHNVLDNLEGDWADVLPLNVQNGPIRFLHNHWSQLVMDQKFLFLWTMAAVLLCFDEEMFSSDSMSRSFLLFFSLPTTERCCIFPLQRHWLVQSYLDRLQIRWEFFNMDLLRKFRKCYQSSCLARVRGQRLQHWI